MPCNDCSRTEKCPPCPYGEDPRGSEPSSTEHKKHCMTHPKGAPNVDGKCCICGITREELEPKPCTCAPDEACDACDLEPPLTPEEEEEAPPDEECCTCNSRTIVNGRLVHADDCSVPKEPWPCGDCGAAIPAALDWCPKCHPEKWHCMHKNGCRHLLTNDCEHGCRDAADELSREANEMEPPPPQAPVDGGVCGYPNCTCSPVSLCPEAAVPMPPPQPGRRPPYAVAYSVQGHLYEVALSGDATVKAVDGALVIQHALGPVAGICQVLPVINEEQT